MNNEENVLEMWNNNEGVVSVTSTNRLQTPSVHQSIRPWEWIQHPGKGTEESKAISKAHQCSKGEQDKEYTLR